MPLLLFYQGRCVPLPVTSRSYEAAIRTTNELALR